MIYLVGAAWLPLGLHAVDRWVRLGRRWGLVELTVVMAMQTLGGDPESAYILGWAAVGYTAGIALSRARHVRPEAPKPDALRPTSSGFWWSVARVVFGLLFWVTASFAVAIWLVPLHNRGHAASASEWASWVSGGVTAAWGLAAAGFVLYWRRRGWRLASGSHIAGPCPVSRSGDSAHCRAAFSGHRVHAADRARRSRVRTTFIGSASSRSGWWSCYGPT